jgi:hypothetical protein
MTRKEQDKRIAELYEWTTHDLAIRIIELEQLLLDVIGFLPTYFDDEIALRDRIDKALGR